MSVSGSPRASPNPVVPEPTGDRLAVPRHPSAPRRKWACLPLTGGGSALAAQIGGRLGADRCLPFGCGQIASGQGAGGGPPAFPGQVEPADGRGPAAHRLDRGHQARAVGGEGRHREPVGLHRHADPAELRAASVQGQQRHGAGQAAGGDEPSVRVQRRRGNRLHPRRVRLDQGPGGAVDDPGGAVGEEMEPRGAVVGSTVRFTGEDQPAGDEVDVADRQAECDEGSLPVRGDPEGQRRRRVPDLTQGIGR